MRLTCSACHAEQSLEAAIGREVDARALAAFIDRNLPLGALLVRYLALFRPEKRRLSFARTVALFEELRPDLERAAITRKGRDWQAPEALWRAAIEQVLAARDKGTLTLPLSSHGYLYEVLAGHADKAEAVAERAHEQAVRTRPPAAGEAPGAVPVVQALQAPAPLAPRPYDPSQGPSRAAREAKARMQATLQARQANPIDTAGAAPVDPPEAAAP